jgi:hypothetical protein
MRCAARVKNLSTHTKNSCPRTSRARGPIEVEAAAVRAPLLCVGLLHQKTKQHTHSKMGPAPEAKGRTLTAKGHIYLWYCVRVIPRFSQ